MPFLKPFPGYADCRWFPLLTVALLVLVALTVPGPVAAQTSEDCLDCHEDEDLTKNVEGRVVSLFIDIDQYENSIHGIEGVECIDCHADLEDFDGDHDEELADVDCSMCHDDVAEIYMGSLHGKGVSEGIPLAPRCWSCHGAHDITPPEDPNSRVNKFNIPIMCGRCHKEGAGVSDYADVSQDSVLAHYSLSIHGEGLYRRGLTGTAVCSDCHTAHNVRNHNAVSYTHLTLPTRCHRCRSRWSPAH